MVKSTTLLRYSYVNASQPVIIQGMGMKSEKKSEERKGKTKKDDSSHDQPQP